MTQNGQKAAPLTYEEFRRVDVRVGEIVRAEAFPKARKPACKLWIDFGELGVRQSSAQITTLYPLEDLPGRQVVAVINFEPKRIADFTSEVLVLGVDTEERGQVVLLAPDKQTPNGSRVY